MTLPQPSEDVIFLRIREAILNHQLEPGQRLREIQICEILNATRGEVRKALGRLAFEGLVDRQPNRGARVARPSSRDAEELFEARKCIETAIAQTAALRLTPKAVKTLRNHLKREAKAMERNDGEAVIALSGEFHLLLADICGNAVLRRYLKDIIARESLIIQLYQRPGSSNCADDDHERIVAALEAGEPSSIAQRIVTHIDHIAAQLDLEPETREPRTLKDILLA